MPQVKQTKQAPVVVNVATQPTPAPNPAPAETQLEENWFFDRLQAIAPEEWAKLYTLEIIRREPKLPSVSGSKGFLDVFTEPITKQFIKQKYGGGKFRLVLLKNSKYVTSHDLDIEGDPIYARGRELPAESAAGSNLEGRLLNMLESNLREMKDELRKREAAGGDPAFSKAVEILSTAYNTGLQNLGNKEQPSPTALLKDLVTTAKDMGLPIGAQPAPPGLNILDVLTALKTLGLLAQPGTAAAAAAPRNMLDDVKTFLEIFDRIDEFRGGNGRPKDWKAALADRVGEALPSILNNIATPRGVRRPGAPPPAARPSVVPASPQPGPNNGNAPAVRHPSAPAPPAAGLRVVSTEADLGESVAARNAERENPASGSTSDTAPTSAASVDTMTASDANFVKRRVVECVERGEDGEGELLVDFLEVAWPAAVNYLEQYPAEQVTAFFSGDPILVQATSNQNWPRVLREAQLYLSNDVPAAVPN